MVAPVLTEETKAERVMFVPDACAASEATEKAIAGMAQDDGFVVVPSTRATS
jgi:hypothetical protein